MIAKKEFFRLAERELLPVLAERGIRQAETWPGFFYRQRGPFLDYVGLGLNRFCEFAHLTACIWVPWIDREQVNPHSIVPEMLGVQVGGEVSPRAIRDSWGWEVKSTDQAVASLQGMAAAIRSTVVPWFEGVDNGASFMRECALNAALWRRLTGVDRQRIPQAIDEAIRGEFQVGQYGFARKNGRNDQVTKEEQTDTAEPAGPYDKVSFQHKNAAVPGLKLTIEGLRKRKIR